MKRSKCNMESMVSAYMDGALSEVEIRRFKVHLKECPECRESLKALTALDKVLRQSSDVSLSPDFDAVFYEKLNRESRKKSWFLGPAPYFSGLKVWAAASACALMIVTGWMLTRPDPVRMTAEEIVIAKHFDILQDFEIIDNLELLENWEALESGEAEL